MQRDFKTIVLIHGLWMTPTSLDLFKHYYEERGYNVFAPAWPRLQGNVEAIRNDPSKLAGLGILEIVDHYYKFISCMDDAPLLIGHSFGGLIAEMLLDRGQGIAGVAIDATAPKGVWRLPLSVIKSASPVLTNPFNYKRTVMLTFEQFSYAFASTMPEAEARTVYDREVIPGPGRPIFQAAFANFCPDAAASIDFRNATRAPLLIVAGQCDHLVPVALNQTTFKKYRQSTASTDYVEFANRSHLIIAQNGWQEVAEYAISWAERKLGINSKWRSHSDDREFRSTRSDNQTENARPVGK
jgi:pimeloyl-ACP methyl ester carboxylesterase